MSTESKNKWDKVITLYCKKDRQSESSFGNGKPLEDNLAKLNELAKEGFFDEAESN